MALKDFALSDQLFIKACELAKTKPTRRQASKWHQKRGLAYAKKDEAHTELRFSVSKTEKG